MKKRLPGSVLVFTRVAVAGLALVSMVAPVHATVTFVSTPHGSTIPGGVGPVDAEAIFTASAGKLEVTLINLQGNPANVGENLSDLDFTIGNGGSLGIGTSGSRLLSSSGVELTVDANHTFSLGDSPVPLGWDFTHTATSGTLALLTDPEAPKHTIIGPPGPGDLYSNANNSIAGNKAHNPFIDQIAMFTITGSGITADTTVTSARFSFGTSPNSFVNGGPPTVTVIPEPASMSIVVMTLTSLAAGVAICRRRRTSPVPLAPATAGRRGA